MTQFEWAQPMTPRPSFYPTTLLDPCTAEFGSILSVAIVMRTKNRPLLLHRALSSVLLQKHTLWHLYLVNDGGERDQVDKLVRSYHHLFDGRITVIHHMESKGMEAASNTALQQATGDLVAVHDDDDAWHPDFLAETTAFLASPVNADYVAVTTGCTLIYEKIERNEVREVSRTPWPHGRNVQDFQHLMVENQFPPICMVFRRSALSRIGAFNEGLKVLGDWEFNLRLSLLGDVGFIDRQLAYYHHRVPKTDVTYGNSVVENNSLHQMQDLRLRNGMIRTALAKSPENLGLMIPIIRGTHQIEVRLAAIETILRQGVPTQRPPRPRGRLLTRIVIGLEFELAKFLCTIGRTSAGTTLWNRAVARRDRNLA